jgi:hypothetical protein
MGRSLQTDEESVRMEPGLSFQNAGKQLPLYLLTRSNVSLTEGHQLVTSLSE